jgi:hypothetical protein
VPEAPPADPVATFKAKLGGTAPPSILLPTYIDPAPPSAPPPTDAGGGDGDGEDDQGYGDDPDGDV